MHFPNIYFCQKKVGRCLKRCKTGQKKQLATALKKVALIKISGFGYLGGQFTSKLGSSYVGIDHLAHNARSQTLTDPWWPRGPSGMC